MACSKRLAGSFDSRIRVSNAGSASLGGRGKAKQNVLPDPLSGG